MSISYSDGAEIESFILSLVRSAKRIDSSANIGREHYSQWAVQYHLSAQRQNLVRHLDWSGLKVMEVGAGMGAVSRYLAERCKHLTVVEGTQARFDVLAARLRDLTNWDGKVGNFESVRTESDYDVVCLIGVLEYSELFVKPAQGDSSFVTMLKRARSCLKPGGAVLVAIENRLGLKYFAGCSEDHTNQIFDGICGYPQGPSPRTFSRAELRAVLAEAGLDNVVEQYPFPDYKLPSGVFGEAMVDRYPATAAELAVAQPYQDYAYAGSTLFPCSLFWESSHGQPNLIKELSNSFLFLASASQKSEALSSLLETARKREELAWYYARLRTQPVKTVFRESSGALAIEKEMLGEATSGVIRYADESMAIEWRNPVTEKEARGTKLTRSLLRHAYFGDHDALDDQLVDFFKWVFNRFKLEGQADSIHGAALDSHAGNAFVSVDGPPYVLIDQEWVLDGPMKKSWFVMRNLCTFEPDLTALLMDRWESLRAFYEHTCARAGIVASFDQDLTTESHFASLLGEGDELESVRTGLEAQFSAAPAGRAFPRTRLELASGESDSGGANRELLRERDRLRAEVNHLNAHYRRKIYWAPRMIDQLITKARRLKRRPR